MDARGRMLAGLTAAVVALTGCRLHPPVQPPIPNFEPEPPPPTLAAIQPISPLPDPSLLPLVDPTVPGGTARPAGVYLQLTEDECRRNAAERATLTRLLAANAAREQAAADAPSDSAKCRHHARKDPLEPSPAFLELRRELRGYASAAARNRTASDALEEFFQLAEAEARGDRIRAGLAKLDQLKAAAEHARELGIRVPVQPDELDRQRAALVGGLEQTELGIALLNIDMKRRLGMPGKSPERLWPVGPFPVSDAPLDSDAAVQLALETRNDLKFLRTAYRKLSPDTFGVIEGDDDTPGMDATFLGRLPKLRAALRDPESLLPKVTDADVAVRRQQLFDLTAERERAVADEVRAAIAVLAAQGRQVGLARWKVEQAAKQAADAKKLGPLAELPALLELEKAHGDLDAAAITWHRSRVKLAAAQGLLGDTAPESK